MNRFAKGTFLLTIAHLFFMGSGYLIQVLLGRYFSPMVYGTFGILVSLLNILSAFAASGVYQSIAKFVAATPTALKAILRFAIKLEFIIVIVLISLFFSLAGPIAINFFKDPDLIVPLRIVVFILPFYIFRSVFFGVLLGLQQYSQLSLIDILSGLVKIVLAVVAVFLGYRLIGILLIYLITAAIGLLLSIWFALKQKVGCQILSFNKKQFLSWSIMLTALAFIMPLFRNMGIFLLKYLEVSSEKVGFYNAAITLGSLPTILLVGLVGAILPSVSETFARKRLKEVKDQINDALRYSSLFLLPLATVLSLTSKAVISIVFSEKYSEAALSFSILIFGFFFFALYNVLNSVLIAMGKGKEIIIYSALFVIIDLLLNLALIPQYGISGAATASFIAFFSAFLVFLTIITLALGTFWLKAWLFRIPFASLVTGGLVYKFFHPILTKSLFSVGLFYILALGIYLGILFFMKECSRKDIILIKNILSFRSH